MSKKHKKRKKLSRRERQQAGLTKPAAPSADEPETVKVVVPAEPKPAAAEPVREAKTVPKPEKAAAVAKTTVSFSTKTNRGPDGIDQQLAAVEYPAVKRDLRKLGITIVAFALIIGGLVMLNNETGLVGSLGNNLFKLWQ